MPLILLAVVLLAAVVLYRRNNRIPPIPQAAGDWGAGGSSDPRIAVAAMLYAVATEYAPLTAEQERHILSLLCSRMGLEPDVAKACFTGGRRIARHLRGDLTSRLHQLLEPVQRKCSVDEKEDVIDMLTVAAGQAALRLGPVREGIGRVSATLMND